MISALTDGFRREAPEGGLVIRVADAGELSLPTGQVVACDPGRLMHDDMWPAFARAVPPGRYPVRVSVAHFDAGGVRVAQAALLLSDAPPVRFELATRPGEDVASLGPDEIFGHGVDSGTSCFADLRTAHAVFERCKDWDYCWKGGFSELCSPGGQKWKNAAVDSAGGQNLVVFESGIGDGRYASYWGFDAEGRVACLVTDFGLLGGPACPECEAEEGKPHRFLCERESCPFCGEPIRSCDCATRVLGLGEDETELLRRFNESFRLGPPRPGLLGWLASFFRPRPLSERELAKAHEIQKRWKRVADARGRIPFGTSEPCPLGDAEDDDDEPPTPAVETLVMMGSMELGRFNLYARPVHAEPGEPDPVRRLVMPPTWSGDRSVMVWNERRGDEDVAAMMWRPENAAERAEAERLYEAARRRSWTTLDELRALLDGPGPWLLRPNMFGVLKYLTENREEVLFAPDSDEGDAPETLADEPAQGATFTREQVLEYIPRLWEEWLQRDEDYYFEPVRPEDVR